jgi:hypothetical protein
MLFAEDSPAKTSPSPESEKASPEPVAASGKSTSASSKKPRRGSSSLKTLRASLLQGWTSLSPISTPPGIEWKPVSSPQPTSELPTEESDSSSSQKAWRTPMAHDAKSPRSKEAAKEGHRQISLTEQIRDWPTPLARDEKGLTSENRNSMSLPDAVKNWPTPVTTDAKSAARGTTTTGVMHQGQSLTDAIREWPTPTASEYGSSNNGCPGDGRTARSEGGVLNPDWVEALMGFPVGWSDGPLDPESLLLFGSLDELP